MEENQNTNELGTQPLDKMMKAWDMSNHNMVDVSTEQLTHKQVQRARSGRRLTLKMMQKVTRAYNVTLWYKLNDEQKERYFEYMHKHLFNYAKGYERDFSDPNEQLCKEVLGKGE